MFRRAALAAVFTVVLTVAASAATDVNQATRAQLESVRGVGPGLALRILDERKRGAFKDWADFVARVPGVGAGNAAKFSAAGLTVGGAGYLPATTASAPGP